MVKSPGTAGEFIQGWYGGSPCLVSCPIDCYSVITVAPGDFRDNRLNEKSQEIVNLFLKKNYLTKDQYQKITIRVTSQIPKGKGMASSTADLAGVSTALSEYFNLGLTPADIARFCARIEPTDNLMFKDLNLFNHLSGRVLKEMGGSIQAKVLVIDFHGAIDTLSFNESSDDYSPAQLRVFADIIRLFEEGVKEQDLSKIGRAATSSARLNQKRLYKPQLDTIIALMQSHQGLGVVVGHSGTVVGVLYQDEDFEKEAFLRALKEKIPKENYKTIVDYHLIKGGVEILPHKNKIKIEGEKMNYINNPREIEERSFEIIKEELGDRTFAATIEPIVMRIIHTTADFEYADLLEIKNKGYESGLAALKAGKKIYADTRMIQVGVNQKALADQGIEIVNYVHDRDVVKAAKERGVTRSTVAMEKALADERVGIFAIGNAPTALYTLIEQVKLKKTKPALIIGAPIGFVGAAESKLALDQIDSPFIRINGRKGGSPVVAAILNAMLYQLAREW